MAEIATVDFLVISKEISRSLHSAAAPTRYSV
jgi:hypothetical protein